MAEVPEQTTYWLTVAEQNRTCQCGAAIPSGSEYVYCQERVYQAVRDDSLWVGPPASYCPDCVDESWNIVPSKRLMRKRLEEAA